jgi:hypothetical protein
MTEFKEDSPSVQSHLSIMQEVIQRMASNSSSCKAWCITLVSAILVIVADKGKPQYVYISIIPTFLFFILDVYYLSLEKRFRESYKDFVSKLHSNSLTSSDLYDVKPSDNSWKLYVQSAKSFSIWPFYVTLFIMIFIVKDVAIASIANP